MFPLRSLINALYDLLNNIIGVAKDSTLSDLINKVAKDSTLNNLIDVVAKNDTLYTIIDTLKPTRAQLTKEIEAYSLDPNSIYELIVSNLDTYSVLIVVVKATYDPNASNGVRVRWLYSPDGSNFDSIEDAEAEGNYCDLTFSAGSTRQRTIIIPIFTDYIKVQIINLDSSYPVTLDVWTLLMR